MKTANVKHSIRICGRKTSVSLEKDFWDGLLEIAKRKNVSVSTLVEKIKKECDHLNLSSAIRIFVYNYFQTQIEQQDNKNIIASEQAAPRDN